MKHSSYIIVRFPSGDIDFLPCEVDEEEETAAKMNCELLEIRGTKEAAYRAMQVHRAKS